MQACVTYLRYKCIRKKKHSQKQRNIDIFTENMNIKMQEYWRKKKEHNDSKSIYFAQKFSRDTIQEQRRNIYKHEIYQLCGEKIISNNYVYNSYGERIYKIKPSISESLLRKFS